MIWVSSASAMPSRRARRGLRLGAGDRDLLPDELVDQRRLARVGRADHRRRRRSGSSERSMNSRAGLGLGVLLAARVGVDLADVRHAHPHGELRRVIGPGAVDQRVFGRLAVRARGPIPAARSSVLGAPVLRSASFHIRQTIVAASAVAALQQARAEQASITSPSTLSLSAGAVVARLLAEADVRRRADLARDPRRTTCRLTSALRRCASSPSEPLLLRNSQPAIASPSTRSPRNSSRS
jgi:hypothetical protein